MSARFLFHSLIVVVLAGCGRSAADPAHAKPEPANARPGNDAQQITKDGMTAIVASWRETEEFIARNKGKVVVLDAWSTSCVPCLREYPHLVALQKKYPQQVICISFNLDFIGGEDASPESGSDAVLDFLVEQKSELHNVISSTPDEEFYQTVDLASIPAVFVYGPDGKLKKRFDNDEMEYGKEGFTYEGQIEPLIESLLQKR